MNKVLLYIVLVLISTNYNAQNVGIGNSAHTPVQRLHVHENSISTGLGVKITNNTTGSTATDGVDLIHGSSGDFEIRQREASALRFLTSNTERFTILSGGNVGIGSTNPGAFLDISSSATTTQIHRITANSLSSGNALQITTSSTVLSGDLVSLTSSGSAAGVSGSVLKLGMTGASSTGTALNITKAGASGAIFRANDDGTYNDASPFIITGNGNVGIGLTSPGAYLDISSSATTTQIQRITANSLSSGNALQINTSSTVLSGDLVSLTSSGNAAGVSGSVLKLGMTGASSTGTALNISHNGSSGYVLRVNDESSYADASPFIIDVAGNVGIGTTSANYKLLVNGRIKTNAINESSDERYKKEIQTIESALSKTIALRGVMYKWRTDKFAESFTDTTLQIGLIAQEVEKILPELVETDLDGYKSVEYSHIVALLIEAIKDQQILILNQRNDLEKLASELNHSKQQNDIEKLKTDVEKLKSYILGECSK